ncbi:MAG: asparagine synthase (glutamine-hydrolyzing) [Planctomycetota bacterium]
MCGVAGIFRLDGASVDDAPLDDMLDGIAHRGPDGRGRWRDRPLALGHVRLGVIDPSERAHQPMVTADGMGVLAYNGEVYNFAALRGELEAEGARFESHGDSAVVLEALHRWGPEAALPRFDGMFAFAYFDRRDGTLWLGRDRFGIKPMHVARRNGALIFASEIKALFAHPAVEPAAAPGALSGYLVYRMLLPETPVFEGIEAILPGTCRRIDRDREETIAYRTTLALVDPGRVGQAGNVDEIEAALRTSVHSHLVSDAPLAAMCSGGVDSSLLTAFARDERPDLEGFVADVGGTVSEWSQAQRVAEHLGMPLHRVAVDRETFLRMWPTSIHHRDAPSVHASDVAMLAVTRACHDAGFKVLLTGEGADEVFGGYAWHASAYRRVRRLRRAARFPWLFPRATRRWQREGSWPWTQGDLDLHARLGAAVAPAIDRFRGDVQAHVAALEPGEDRALLAMQLSDLRFHLAWLLHRHDAIGMAASIESRVPFLAHAVADLGLHLAPEQKIRNGVSKWALKEVAARRLPPEVVHAPKKGFIVSPHLFAGTTALLEGGHAARVMGWTRRDVQHIVQTTRPDGALAYQLVCLEIWARLCFGDESCEQIGERLTTL